MQQSFGDHGGDVESLYAITLIIAIAAGAVAILTSILGLVKPEPQMEPSARIWRLLLSDRLTQLALGLGAFSLATSVVVHSQWGHGPGTMAPMDLVPLLSEHEAFPAAGAILLLGLVLAIYRSRR